MKLDWKGIVGAVAPTLATALGGPLAGVAVKTIATQFLGKPDASESDVEQAVLAADPQALIRLKEIDLEFEKAMASAGIELERLGMQDRVSAREREIKTGDSWTPRAIAALVVVGWFLIRSSTRARGQAPYQAYPGSA